MGNFEITVKRNENKKIFDGRRVNLSGIMIGDLQFFDSLGTN